MLGEQVILVFNNDNDILMAVRPVDALNPQFDMDEIEQNVDLHAKLIPINSLADFRETQKEGYR